MNRTDLMKTIKKSQGQFELMTCPFFGKDGKCTIYSKRPKCCRNYPQKESYCSNENCGMFASGTKKIDCSLCKDKCCERILVPKNIVATKEFFIDWLDIDCDACREVFKHNLNMNEKRK